MLEEEKFPKTPCQCDKSGICYIFGNVHLWTGAANEPVEISRIHQHLRRPDRLPGDSPFINKILGADQSWLCWKLWYTYKWEWYVEKESRETRGRTKRAWKSKPKLVAEKLCCINKQTKTLEFEIKKT